MATANVNDWSDVANVSKGHARAGENPLWNVLKVVGSLKFTVALFACSTLLVLVGTLAQEELNMVEVKKQYFTSWIALADVEHFVPQAFIMHERIPGVIPMPGGALLGLLLMVNLIASKVTRFHVRASGKRLALGASVFAFGLVLCYGVVVLGNAEGVQGEPPFEYKTLWSGLVAGMVVLWLAAVYEAFTAEKKGWRRIWTAIALATGLMGAAALLGYFQMSASSLRITWQLIEGTIVATVLLVGARIMFAKQGGNLLLHFGIALLMVGQFVFGDTQLEQRLSLVEGESTNMLVNLDRIELAFVEDLENGRQRISTIPEKKLKAVAGQDTTIQDERLPFDVRVVSFFDNSDLTTEDENTIATAGVGTTVVAKEAQKKGGVTSQVDLAAAYVELLDKQSGESKGTYLVAQLLNDRVALRPDMGPDEVDSVSIDDKSYELALRFERVPKPYWVQVDDVRRVNYSGTDTPRDYSSFITLVDTDSGKVENARIWMNNPLRYRGETFYQSNYERLPGGKEYTSLQVVRNAGWMIPYLACMIVAVGMIAHFTGTLDRFLGRREREEKPKVKFSRSALIYPSIAGLFIVAAATPWTAVKQTMRPADAAGEFNMYRAASIPVRFGGRVMPLNAYAHDALQAVSNKTSLPLKAKYESDPPPAPQAIIDRAGKKKRLTALEWLFEVASDEMDIRDLHMFRIDADELLDHFKLDRRRSKLYGLSELLPQFESFDAIVQEAYAKMRNEEPTSFKEKKFVELASRLDAFQKARIAFAQPSLPQIPAQFQSPDITRDQRISILSMMLQRQLNDLETATVAAVIPPTSDETAESVDSPPWKPLSWGRLTDMIAGQIEGTQPTPGVEPFTNMMDAYMQQDAVAFNEAATAQLSVVNSLLPRDYNPSKVRLERWLEGTYPTSGSVIMYGLLMVIGIIAIAIGKPGGFQGVWLGIAVVAVLHTFIVLARVYITGRAPVINLYSSAVFIGWATVVSGLVFERIFRNGIGNVIAAMTGMLSLMVAHALNDGDTMPVLQAVLDTQFWLATHVITVTLGYAATFVAGMLGIGYLVTRIVGMKNSDSLPRDIYRMTYSAACFGILFSFIGTVLGGLWADDSWGRFWGWDPKENGALLIVIWNALVLHARWDGMVKERGFALLAIGGNIVTAWSWFGTNQLGIGLHSYGFTEGALALLTLFVLSQLAIIVWGLFATRPSTSS